MIRGDRLLPLPALESKVGFKHTKIYALIREDKLPPGKLIYGKRLWRESEIDAWIERAWAEVGTCQHEENQAMAAPQEKSPTSTPSSPPPASMYWSSSYLRARYGISRTTLYRWINTSGFPAPAISGEHGSQSRWHADDVLAWEGK